MNRDAKNAQQPKAAGKFRLLLLAAVLAVGGLVVYVAVKPSRPGKPDAPSDEALAQQVLQRARPLVALGQHVRAADLMQAYVSSHPGDIEVRPLLAEAQISARQFDNAQLTLDRLLAVAPRHAHGLWLQGQLKRRLGDKNYADFYRQAMEAPDAGPDTWARFGLYLLEQGQRPAAYAQLQRAYDAGLTDARTSLPLGELALAQGQADKAETLARQAMRDEPTNARAWSLLAETLRNQGRNAEAASTMLQALERMPASAAIFHMQLGEAKLAQQQASEAVDSFVKAGRDPQLKPRAYFRAAQAAYQAGQYDLALTMVSIVEGLSDDDAQVQTWKEKVQAALAKRDVTSQPARP